MAPSSFFNPNIMFSGSLGLFRANQYFENCSPSFRNLAWADFLAFSILFSFILFREAFRNSISSLAFSLSALVAFLEVILLLWVFISFLKALICFLAFFFSWVVILIAISFISSLTFFHLAWGFCLSLLSNFTSCSFSHRSSSI